MPDAFVLDMDEVVRVLDLLFPNGCHAFFFDLDEFVNVPEVLLPSSMSSQEYTRPEREEKPIGILAIH